VYVTEAVARPLEFAALADLSMKCVDSGQQCYSTDVISRHQNQQRILHRRVGENYVLSCGLSM